MFQSVWIAFSALYPQAFDENFHYGLIKVYSHYWLPFLSHQPPNANAYGAVARDPSYLYHYLMSFPYRVIALFVHSQTAQVIILRLMDTGLFVLGLVLFRKVLSKAGLSKPLTNVCLFLFIMIPIVPQLAAQVSYDDLLFPLVAWICLMTFNVIDDIKSKKLSLVNLYRLAIICCLTSLVKYAFLPIFLAIVMYLAGLTYRRYQHNFGGLIKATKKSYRASSRRAMILLPIGLLLCVGLIFQRDGINLIKYHTIEPNCSKVLTVKQCSAYSPWFYNYNHHNSVLKGTYKPNESLLVYTRQWFYWMWYRLFFAVNGLTSGFASDPPLPLPSRTAAFLALGGLVALIWSSRRVFRRNPYISFLFLACVVYGITLYVQGYSTYKYTDVLENMNGRYLIPIMLPLAAAIGLAISKLLGKSQTPKAVIATVAVVMFLQGGGLLTFILNSDETWYWPNSAVVKINKEAKKITRHVIRAR